MISILSEYLNHLSDVELLSPEDELRLAKGIEQGDKASKDRLIESNLRLVVSIAKRYAGYGIPFSDIIQAGNEGLIKASERYDWRRGVKFSTVAEQWITQAISSYVSQQSKTIRTPPNVVRLQTKYRRLIDDIYSKGDEMPDIKTISELLDVSEEYLESVVSRMNNVLSLDDIWGDDFRFEDTVVDEEAQTFEDAVDNILRKDLLEAVQMLDERSSYILTRRFGLDNKPIESLEDVGNAIGISRERVRQLERDALKRLKKSPSSSHLISYL
jgi:RNA polymerase primary sigma factor